MRQQESKPVPATHDVQLAAQPHKILQIFRFRESFWRLARIWRLRTCFTPTAGPPFLAPRITTSCFPRSGTWMKIRRALHLLRAQTDRFGICCRVVRFLNPVHSALLTVDAFSRIQIFSNFRMGASRFPTQDSMCRTSTHAVYGGSYQATLSGRTGG